MGVSFIYTGKRGSNLECAIALHRLATQLGFESSLILSTDNEKLGRVKKLYPEAEAYDFHSLAHMIRLKAKLERGVAFFTMISPKMVPLFLSLKSKKIFYYHSTYDYSFFGFDLRDRAVDHLQDMVIRNATMTVATQHYLSWQIKKRLGKDADELPHPSYAGIKQAFFEKPKSVDLPFENFFLKIGDNSYAKGAQVIHKAIDGTDLKTVVVGRGEKLPHLPNLHSINKWIVEGELHYLIRKARYIVLPYLMPSLFSGSTALAFHFRKPVLAPFSPAFERLIEPGKTGMFFSAGDADDLRKKMQQIAKGGGKYSTNAIAAKEKEMDARTAKKLKEILVKLGA